jgi:nucleoside-diphosphate-sugar epimerase
MFLSIKKLRSLGWTPSHNSEQSIRLATRQILKELGGKPPRA